MKKTLFFILCALFLITITGCEKEKVQIGDKSNKIIVDNGVSFAIKKDSITKDGATFIIQNNSDDTISYDGSYELEILKDNEWHVFNLKIQFIMSNPDILNINESRELVINFMTSYDNLDKGKYRLIKLVKFENESKKSYISAEFELK